MRKDYTRGFWMTFMVSFVYSFFAVGFFLVPLAFFFSALASVGTPPHPIE